MKINIVPFMKIMLIMYMTPPPPHTKQPNKLTNNE